MPGLAPRSRRGSVRWRPYEKRLELLIGRGEIDDGVLVPFAVGRPALELRSVRPPVIGGLERVGVGAQVGRAALGDERLASACLHAPAAPQERVLPRGPKLHPHEWHVAVLTPLAEPLLALLQRDEVQMRIDVIDVADAAAHVIEHWPCRVELPDRSLALAGDGGAQLPMGVGDRAVATDEAEPVSAALLDDLGLIAEAPPARAPARVDRDVLERAFLEHIPVGARRGRAGGD
jgi:hypothetical protein